MLYVDKKSLDSLYPTHMQSPEFWEWLGRAIATCSYLESVLKTAIFVFSSQQPVIENKSGQEAEQWKKFLSSTRTSQLSRLVSKYEKLVCDTPNGRMENFDKLIKDLKEVGVIRNLLCHATWLPHASGNSSLPGYVDRRKGVCEQNIDIDFLRQTQKAVLDIAIAVINSVTRMGWEFPGIRSK